jgi:hypothetical protein
VYRLNEGLYVHRADGRVYYKAGSEVSAEELEGLVLPALEQGGFITRKKTEPYPCPACAEHGSAKQKKERHASLEDLVAHYAAEHPALAPPEEA